MGKINLKKLSKYLSHIPVHFVDSPGEEAYKLYAEISLDLGSGLISDLGTYQGLSALALSYNPLVEVVSYDIDLDNNLALPKKNITYVKGNVLDHLLDIIKSDLILVDIDPHDGIQESILYKKLIELGYEGVTVWDDIHLNSNMQLFWDSVRLPSKDVSKKGHHSGTGLIFFT